MILQALSNFYEMKSDDPNDQSIPQIGFSLENISFIIVIDKDGNWISTTDYREDKNRGTNKNPKFVPRRLKVPEGQKRTGMLPNFLWDETIYVLGSTNKNKSDDEVLEYNKVFKDNIHSICKDSEDEGYKAITRFYEKYDKQRFIEDKYFEEMVDTKVAFRLDTDQMFLHERPEIRKLWLAERRNKNINSGVQGRCLISGEKDTIARIHPSIKGLNAMGVSIVSFKPAAFDSYGKKQSYNAPVSVDSAFKYVTALNYLLKKGSGHEMYLGNDTKIIFWTGNKTVSNYDTDVFGRVINYDDKILENDSEEDKILLSKVSNFMKALRDGTSPPEEIEKDKNSDFFIMGVSPNRSRLAIRFWYSSTIEKMNNNLASHLMQTSLEKTFNTDPEFIPLWRILLDTTVNHEMKNANPKLAGELARAVFSGSNYPLSLFNAILERVRVEHQVKGKKSNSVSYTRCAIIKAILMRNYNQKELTVSLDTENKNTAYLLGRLFATMEKLQIDALGNINSSIKDKFYSNASTTPSSTFPYLLRLSNHHLKKLDSSGFYNIKIGEILDGIDEFPKTMSMEKQGLFAIGYYHQRNDFYRPKNKDNKETKN